jgi:hypothetical protein
MWLLWVVAAVLAVDARAAAAASIKTELS